MPRKQKNAGDTPPEAKRHEELLRATARLFVDQAVGMRSGRPFYHSHSKQERLKAAMADGLATGYRRM